MQYAAYHFQLDDIRSLLPEGEELLRLGRALSQRMPSVARLKVLHGQATVPDLVQGPAYVIAFSGLDKTTRQSIDANLRKIKGYRGERVIELGRAPGYDLKEGHIPKP
jgi:hypothetical protein